MSENNLLKATSVLAVVLMSLHVADDIVRGFEDGGPENLAAIPIFVVWLYGTLLLGERRSGLIIMLLGNGMGAFVPVLHFQAAGGVAGRGIAESSGALFWVWTLLALGVCATFAFVLAARALWRSSRPITAST